MLQLCKIFDFQFHVFSSIQRFLLCYSVSVKQPAALGLSVRGAHVSPMLVYVHMFQ